jgi:hypothetical protein
VAGQKRIVEKLWREFFSDPSQWQDHRLMEKVRELLSEETFVGILSLFNSQLPLMNVQLIIWISIF